MTDETSKHVRISRIRRTDEEKQIVYGQVYAPYQFDTFGEFMLPEDIETMAHRYMELALDETIDVNHDNNPTGSYPVESWINTDHESPDWDYGAWVLGVKVPDESLWDDIKTGKINGFSFEALVKSVIYTVRVKTVRDHVGITETVNGHNHTFFVYVDPMGKIQSGFTSEDEDHFHEITRGSFTAPGPDGHTHRYTLG